MKFYQKPELKRSFCALDAALAAGIEETGSEFGGNVDLGDQEFGNED